MRRATKGLLYLLIVLLINYSSARAAAEEDAEYVRMKSEYLLDELERDKGYAEVRGGSAAPEENVTAQEELPPLGEMLPPLESEAPSEEALPFDETLVSENEGLPKASAAGAPVVVEYYIAPGDTMEIVVLENPLAAGEAPPPEPVLPKDKGSQKEYAIAAGDAIEILVWQSPDLSKDIIVGPDGKISYPLIGRFQAAGLSIDQLEATIAQGLSNYVKSPRVAVMIRSFAQEKEVAKKAEEKKESILDKIGASRSVVVGPDGKISYPLIGRIQAAGLTITQLEDAIAAALIKYVRAPRVSIMMTTFTGDKLIIMGEVYSPGIYTYYGKLNLIEALAMAGDFTPDARRDSVMVIHGNLTDAPEVTRINMSEIILRGTTDVDVMLRPNDVIYVPKSYIASFNKFLSNIAPSISAATSFMNLRQTAPHGWHTNQKSSGGK